MVGDERDLSQVSAVGALTAGSGAPTEHVSFAAALLGAVAPDWSGRNDWLRTSLASANAAEANFKADHVVGPLNVHLASWRSLGVYRLTVETVEAAAQSAALAAVTEKPSTTGSSASSPASKPGEAPVAAKPANSAGSPSTGASVETKSDGSLIVDGKYALKGAGTKESPYKLTWDQLVSAQDDYVPRDGRKEIPSRISMLDGKWIEITWLRRLSAHG
jgi:hypothetical protein